MKRELTAPACFGPVPSRRLGQSLGVNNVPYKSCSYSCVYCQLGPTRATTVSRQSYRAERSLFDEIRARLGQLAVQQRRVDFVTFVPDGEPTLDLGLADALEGLAQLGVRTAVISNASLIGDPEVRRALALASWVSLKVDAGDEQTWRAVNRPDPGLEFADLIEGARRFATRYQGTLVTETMLVDGLNDGESAVVRTARRVAELSPTTAFVATPTRPAGEAWVRPPSEEAIARAYAIFARHGITTELLGGYPEPDFAATSDVASGLLAITAVHPMREIEVEQFLSQSNADWSVIQPLLTEGSLRRVSYLGETFFVRSRFDAT